MAEQKYIQAVYEGRASYLNVFEPHAMSEGDPPMYSLCLIIPKSDKETITGLYKAVEAAKEIGKKQLWGGVIPEKIGNPIHDGNVGRPKDPKDFAILLYAYAFDDQPVTIIDLACGEELPDWMIEYIRDASVTKVAYNAMFERTCLSVYLGEQLSPDGWKCIMVQACYLSLPLSLEGCAEALKTVEQKDKEGHDLIRYFCVPCKPTKLNSGRTWNLPEHAPEKWDKFKYYCCQDVETERDIEKKISLYPISPHEMELYRLDQRINDRGVLVDMELVKQAIACDVMHSETATARAYELTGCDNPNSVSQLKGWLSEQGVEIDSLSKKAVKQTMKELEKNASSNAEAIEVLALRAKMAKSSVKKYEAAARSVCKDGRIHGCFQFMGANRTGSWKSVSWQVCARPTLKS